MPCAAVSKALGSVDTQGFRLQKGDAPRQLTPRAFDVLLFLIEQRGRIVEKPELFNHIWKGAFVTDNALTRVIKEIRRAIGDDANAPRYIETVPKRGYRFIGEIRSAPMRLEPQTPAPSIAVMPFVNASTSAETEYLCEGLTTSLINTLSRLSGVRVLARSTVFNYARRGEIVPAVIGRELQVNRLLTGRVVALGDRLVISAELANAPDGTHLWGQQYKRPMCDIMEVQEEIAIEIARRLQPQLSASEHSHLGKHYTENSAAYLLYLKGYYFLYKFTAEGLAKSFDCFHEAIAKDANYALAYAGLVEAYFNLSFRIAGRGLDQSEKRCLARVADRWPTRRSALCDGAGQHLL